MKKAPFLKRRKSFQKKGGSLVLGREQERILTPLSNYKENTMPSIL